MESQNLFSEGMNNEICKRKNKQWTTKDLKYLQLMYPVASTQAIAKEMGISFYSVKYALEKYNVLKMRKKKKEPVKEITHG